MLDGACGYPWTSPLCLQPAAILGLARCAYKSTCTKSRESNSRESKYWTGLESKILDRSGVQIFGPVSQTQSPVSSLPVLVLLPRRFGGGGRRRARSLDEDLRVGEV